MCFAISVSKFNAMKNKPMISGEDYQIIMAEIDALAKALAECYPLLPNKAKAKAISLGHSMSVMRKRLKSIFFSTGQLLSSKT